MGLGKVRGGDAHMDIASVDWVCGLGKSGQCLLCRLLSGVVCAANHRFGCSCAGSNDGVHTLS